MEIHTRVVRTACLRGPWLVFPQMTQSRRHRKCGTRSRPICPPPTCQHSLCQPARTRRGATRTLLVQRHNPRADFTTTGEYSKSATPKRELTNVSRRLPPCTLLAADVRCIPTRTSTRRSGISIVRCMKTLPGDAPTRPRLRNAQCVTGSRVAPRLSFREAVYRTGGSIDHLSAEDLHLAFAIDLILAQKRIKKMGNVKFEVTARSIQSEM